MIVSEIVSCHRIMAKTSASKAKKARRQSKAAPRGAPGAIDCCYSNRPRRSIVCPGLRGAPAQPNAVRRSGFTILGLHRCRQDRAWFNFHEPVEGFVRGTWTAGLSGWTTTRCSSVAPWRPASSRSVCPSAR